MGGASVHIESELVLRLVIITVERTSLLSLTPRDGNSNSGQHVVHQHIV